MMRSKKPRTEEPTQVDPELELRSRKLYGQLFNGLSLFQHDVDTYAYYFQPDCTPLKTLRVALGFKSPIVLASVSPIFGSAAIKQTFHDDIEGFNKMKSDMLSQENGRLERTK
jgi:hypothetical protein